MRRSLAFENSPALSAPLRFFLNVPLFILLAAALLFWAGPQALSSRWSLFALALTHLLTLGVLASAMVGALIQILPVATGVRIPAARANAIVIHVLLAPGTLVLAAAFVLAEPGLFRLALLLLGAAFAWLLLACARAFWQHRGKAAEGAGEILLAVRLALLALSVAVALGVTLAAGLAWGLPLSFVALTNLHGLWGLAGWVGLLVIGISYQVIPIFQVTELYPRRVSRWLAATVFGMLVLWSTSAHTLGSGHAASGAAAFLIAMAYAVFAATTFYLLWTRKRPKADTTTLFWRTAMISLAGCGLVWGWQLADAGRDFSVTLGVLFIVGAALSAINGMLYKIIPFLLWYNAQKTLLTALRIVPKVQYIIPDEVAVKQFWAHLTALLLLVAASIWPTAFTHAAALALAVSGGWLGRNMANALRLYLRVRRQIDAIQAKPGER